MTVTVSETFSVELIMMFELFNLSVIESLVFKYVFLLEHELYFPFALFNLKSLSDAFRCQNQFRKNEQISVQYCIIGQVQRISASLWFIFEKKNHRDKVSKKFYIWNIKEKFNGGWMGRQICHLLSYFTVRAH